MCRAIWCADRNRCAQTLDSGLGTPGGDGANALGLPDCCEMQVQMAESGVQLPPRLRHTVLCAAKKQTAAEKQRRPRGNDPL